MKSLISTVMCCLGFVFGTQAQTPSLSPWEMNKGEGVIDLPAGVKSRKGAERLSLVYEYDNIPKKQDPNWQPAPVQNGVVSYGTSNSSILDKKKYDQFTQLDFTYFRAFLDVPKDFKVNQASVTIGQVDDQGRMMLFNGLNPDGIYVEANDGKRGGKDFTTDFTKYIVPGINTFKIVQVDDNCCGNMMTGSLTVKINNAVIPSDPAWTQSHKVFVNQKEYAEAALVGDVVEMGDEYILTPDQGTKNGAVWSQGQIDLTKDFEIKAEINLGNKDGGADGIALVFQNKNNHQLGVGGSLGYKDVSPSYIIEFDTYQNRDENQDPAEDHVGKRVDGSPAHKSSSEYKTVGNLEDGKFHPIVFTWHANTKTFDLKLDGKDIFTNDKFPQSSLSGQNVYFGFTAATGNAFNKQIVRGIYYSPK